MEYDKINITALKFTGTWRWTENLWQKTQGKIFIEIKCIYIRFSNM